MGAIRLDRGCFQDRQAEYSEISLNFQRKITDNQVREPALAFA